MNTIVLGFLVAFVIFASANGTKVSRCMSTFRSSMDPACSMLTTNPNNSMMCTSADVFSEVSGYFSVNNEVNPLCVTYIFKSDAPVGKDDFPEGIWLFRGVNFDKDYKTCEDICRLVRITIEGTNYKNFFVGCHLEEDGNNENITDFWNIHTQYDCSTDDMYYNKTKPLPMEVTTTPAPSTSKVTTPKASTVSGNPSTDIQTTNVAADSTNGFSGGFMFEEKLAEAPKAEAPKAQVVAETTAAPAGSNANLFIGIAQGVIGALGTAIIITSAVTLYLTCKKIKSHGESPSE